MSTFKVEVTVPEGLTAGDKFTVDVTAPAKEKKDRGQLAGIALCDMSIEQVKREIVNSKSVLYKAQKRGAAAEVIAKNQERVDAVVAEKAKRFPEVVAVATAVEEVINNEVTNEI